MLYQPPRNRGVSVVELLIATAIIVTALAGILGLAAFSVVTANIAEQTTEAALLAEESMEAARNIRDGTDWNTDGLATLSTGTDYHPEFSGTPPAWQMVAGAETIGIFTRKIVFSDVCRDASDDITACPGSYTDADAKQAVVTVTWTERARTHQVETTAYFTNWNQ